MRPPTGPRPVAPRCPRCHGPAWVISRRCIRDCHRKPTTATTSTEDKP